VALTRLPNGHYVCGAWSDDDAGPKRLDLYLSVSPTFDGRFRQSAATVHSWVPDDADPDSRSLNFQAVNFVHGLDGRLYLLGFGVDGKTHVVEIYTVDFPGAHLDPEDDAGVSPPIVKRLRPRRTFRCQPSQCDMRGASGAYVDGGLILYSGAQYRGKRAGDPVRFAEFTSPLPGVSRSTATTAWVELYDQPGLQGAKLTLRDLQENGTIANYKDLRVIGRHFGDRARSARYQIPLGRRYTLYKHDGFREPIIHLRGTGLPEVEPDFAALGGEVSSSRLEQEP
ncbi:MAG: hypothetical protein O6951_11985, partial [Actinobacteria bacterium]|nr:hypothetical protein [Actinomycetota bacterium]